MTRLDAVQNALGAMLNAELMNMGTIQSLTSYTHHVELTIHFNFGDPYKMAHIKQLKQHLFEETRRYMRSNPRLGYSVFCIEWRFESHD